MDKAFEMGKSSATGSFYLLIGVALSTIVLAVGTLVIASMLPASDVGLYGTALIPSSIISFFRDWGVSSALTQRIASLRAAGKESEIHDVIYSGVIFEIITGVVLSVICFAVAEPLAYILSPNNVGDLTTYISIMSISVFAGALAAAAGGIFVGFERMKLNSLTQILQAFVKAALGPVLIIIGFGVLGAIYATVVSTLVGGVIAILLVYFVLFRPLAKCKVGKCDIKRTLRPMLDYGLPLTVSSIVIGVIPQVVAFSMAIYAGKGDLLDGHKFGWMMGNYYVAGYFAVLLSFISFPVATALFPVFSKIDPEKEPGLIKTVFASSVKYTALLLVPATMLLVALSTPLINTLFPLDGLFRSLFVVDAAPKYPYGPLFLALSCSVNLLVLVGNISVGTFQTGIKKTRQVMWQSVASLVIGLPLAYLIIMYFFQIGGAQYAVIGGIIGSLVATLPQVVWALHWSWKNYDAKADFGSSAKIFAASLLAAAVTYVFVSLLKLPYLFTLILGFAAFALIFLVSAPLIGAVNRSDLDNIQKMLSSLGVISAILKVPLGFMRRLCRSNNDAGGEKRQPMQS